MKGRRRNREEKVPRCMKIEMHGTTLRDVEYCLMYGNNMPHYESAHHAQNHPSRFNKHMRKRDQYIKGIPKSERPKLGDVRARVRAVRHESYKTDKNQQKISFPRYQKEHQNCNQHTKRIPDSEKGELLMYLEEDTRSSPSGALKSHLNCVK